MILLLDTHIILWMTEQQSRLGRGARRDCDAALAAGELAVPTIIYYELGQLQKRGRIAIGSSIRDWRARLVSLGVREFALSADVALRAADLENLPGDPFDRLIVATALVEQATLLTADRGILGWTGKLSRQDAHR